MAFHGRGGSLKWNLRNFWGSQNNNEEKPMQKISRILARMIARMDVRMIARMPVRMPAPMHGGRRNIRAIIHTTIRIIDPCPRDSLFVRIVMRSMRCSSRHLLILNML